MRNLKLGITTQTPLLRFPGNGHEGTGTLTLRLRDVGADGGVHLSPGGVTRMVFPKIREWARAGWMRDTHWFSLQPRGPRLVRFRDLPLSVHHLSLPAANLRAYARTKEKLWNAIHGLASPKFDSSDFRFYSHYNWFTADTLLQHLPDLDIAYIHDFQLLQLGALTGLAAPSCFRWHVPFVPAVIPSYTRNFLIRTMEDFDLVVVSTRRDLEGLTQAGFHGVVRQVYPDIDLSDWPTPTANAIRAFEAELGLREDDPVAVMVARMDPMKRHDLAIQALAKLRHHVPRLQLVLVGNGSFSASKGTGLGLGKSAGWARHLHQLARRLKVQDRVHFAHWINDARLAAAYARADFALLPSDLEGFGLTIFEAWRYGRPAVVSSGAGVSEVIHDGHDGFLFDAGDVQGLADAMKRALRGERAQRIGRAGRAAVQRYDVRHAAQKIQNVLEETINRFGGPES